MKQNKSENVPNAYSKYKEVSIYESTYVIGERWELNNTFKKDKHLLVNFTLQNIYN